MKRFAFAAVLLCTPTLLLAACSPSPAPATCIAGERPVCGCADGRTGYQECLADGVFGACVCADPADSGTLDLRTAPLDLGPPDLGTAPVDFGPAPTDFGTDPVDFGGGPVDAGPPPGDPSIVRTAPATSIVHTRDTLMLQFVVARPIDRVELLLDGAVFAELAPPYSYVWDTRPYAEGPHTIVARAVRGTDVRMSAELTAVVDRTSPYVVSRFPVPGETNVWLGKPFEVVFSEPLETSTVNDTAITITNGGATPLRKSVTVDATGTRISVELDTTPVLPTTVRLDVTSGATDLAGNPVVSDAWPMTIPAWHQVGEVIDIGPSQLELTMDDANGHPYVGILGADLHVAHHDGSAWTILPSIEPDLTAYVAEFSMAAGPSGEPVVAWISSIGSTTQILVSRWTGSAWVSLGGGPLTTPAVSNPRVALDSAGVPVLAWIESGTLQVARWTGATWALVGTLTTPSTPSLLGLAVTSTDEIVIAYGGAPGVSASAMRWTGTAWEALGGPIFTSGATMSTLRLAAGPGGALAAFGSGSTGFSFPSPVRQINRLRAGAWARWLTPSSTFALLAYGAGDLEMTAVGGVGVTVARYLASGTRTSSVTTANTFLIALDAYFGSYPAVAISQAGGVGVYLSNDL